MAGSVAPETRTGTPDDAVRAHYGDGGRRKDEGSAQVLSKTPEEYQRAFAEVFEEFILSGNGFTSEHVTERVGMPPNHPNAVGALFSSLVKQAAKTGRVAYVMHVKATRSNQNATKIGLYRGTGK